MLQQRMHRLAITTSGSGCTDITARLQGWLREAGANDGMLTLFLQHTSASLTIQENADPDVLRDLEGALDRLAPRGHAYRHDCEGPDDMPAHIRTMLTETSLAIPVLGGRAALGQWQAVYLLEHRDRPHERHLVLHFLGTGLHA